MKKFLIFLACALSAPSFVSADDYVFYNPIVEKIRTNANYNIVQNGFVPLADVSSSVPNVVCVAPEKNGESMTKTVKIYNPLGTPEKMPDPFSEDFWEKLQKFDEKYQISLPLISGWVWQEKKKMIAFSLSNDAKICNFSDTPFWNIREDFMKNIRSGDSLTFVVQYPQNTTISAYFFPFFFFEKIMKKPMLFPIPFERKMVVTGNWMNLPSSDETDEKNDKVLEWGSEFLCFGADSCEIEKMEITRLNGEKVDYTNEAQNFKKWKDHEYLLMDREYFNIPLDAASVKIWYK